MSKNHNSIEQPKPKSFGVVFSVVFLLIAIYPLFKSHEIHLWALTFSLIFLVLALVAPNSLALPNMLWFRFGILLGSVIAPIVMVFVYLVSVLPTGIIMRLLGKDLLNRKLDKNAKSYWIERSETMGSMKNQF